MSDVDDLLWEVVCVLAVYRYAFAQWWGDPVLRRMAAWVLLNPAPGDADGQRRPVLDGCIARTQAWGFNGLVIVNLFAYRERYPNNMTANSVTGPYNDDFIREVTLAAG